MKVIIIKDKDHGSVTSIKSFGMKDPKNAVNEAYRFLVHDISAKAFERVIKKLRKEGLLDDAQSK